MHPILIAITQALKLPTRYQTTNSFITGPYEICQTTNYITIYNLPQSVLTPILRIPIADPELINKIIELCTQS